MRPDKLKLNSPFKHIVTHLTELLGRLKRLLLSIEEFRPSEVLFREHQDLLRVVEQRVPERI